jgi:hypothetical protein
MDEVDNQCDKLLLKVPGIIFRHRDSLECQQCDGSGYTAAPETRQTRLFDSKAASCITEKVAPISFLIS